MEQTRFKFAEVKNLLKGIGAVIVLSCFKRYRYYPSFLLTKVSKFDDALLILSYSMWGLLDKCPGRVSDSFESIIGGTTCR